MAGCLFGAVARAEEPAREEALLDAPGPPQLPGLSHRGLAFNLEYTVASAEPTEVTRAYAYAARWLVEAPISSRQWFFGLQHDYAAARVPGGTSALVGNPELWGRGFWTSKSGLGAGGGLSLVLPVPRTFTPLEAEVVRAIRVVRPWDYAHFQDLTITARPYFDLRHVVGPVTLQMRQGVDLSLLLRDRSEEENRYDITAVGSFFVDVEVIEPVHVGLELQEVYQLTADVDSPTCIAPCDEARAAFSLAPGVRMKLRHVSPAVSLLLPLSTPLRNEVSSYIGARVHLDGVL